MRQQTNRKQTKTLLCVGEILCVGRNGEIKMKNVDQDKVWSVLGKLVVAEVIIGAVLIITFVASYIKEVI